MNIPGHVTDFSTHNKLLSQKLLKQGYRYNKLRKSFSKFYRRYYGLISNFQVGLKSLLVHRPDSPCINRKNPTNYLYLISCLLTRTGNQVQVVCGIFVVYTGRVKGLCLVQGLSEPEFDGDLVYKLKKIAGSNNFSAQFIKIISHFKKDWL